MADTSFYNKEELKLLGFSSIGENVKISKKASIYSPEKICIGSNVRIDDFCILSGNITLGDNIHISAYCALYGQEGIFLDDYTGMSPRSTIFSAMDDFGGDHLIGPIHPSVSTNVSGGLVLLKKYSQLGCNTVVFPNITIHEGAVAGSFTLVNRDLESWTINVGIPINKTWRRKRGLLRFV